MGKKETNNQPSQKVINIRNDYEYLLRAVGKKTAIELLKLMLDDSRVNNIAIWG